ncbi:unnamed protein product, partial [marine sediment metagenome]
NRRFAFLVAEKLWGIKDNGVYMNEEYFKETYLPDLLEKCTKDMWMWKYLNIVKQTLFNEEFEEETNETDN